MYTQPSTPRKRNAENRKSAEKAANLLLVLARSLREKNRVGEHEKIEVERENKKKQLRDKIQKFSRRKRTHDCA